MLPFHYITVPPDQGRGTSPQIRGLLSAEDITQQPSFPPRLLPTPSPLFKQSVMKGSSVPKEVPGPTDKGEEWK